MYLKILLPATPSQLYFSCKIIKSWIVKNLVNTSNPREHGKGLTANLAGLWRYCISDYRIILKPCKNRGAMKNTSLKK